MRKLPTIEFTRNKNGTISLKGSSLNLGALKDLIVRLQAVADDWEKKEEVSIRQQVSTNNLQVVTVD